MKNLLPSGLEMHHKFDLKGSTYKRKASRKERNKSHPTFKDLDFMEMYPEGMLDNKMILCLLTTCSDVQVFCCSPSCTTHCLTQLKEIAELWKV